MSAESHTMYAAGLFLALISLWLWSKRRRRISRMVSRAVRSMYRDDAA